MGLRHEIRMTRIKRDSEADQLESLMRVYNGAQESIKNWTGEIGGLVRVERLVQDATNLEDLFARINLSLEDTRESRDTAIELLDTTRKEIEESKTRIKLLTDKLENLTNDPA